jgi:hypothetical protein
MLKKTIQRYALVAALVAIPSGLLIWASTYSASNEACQAERHTGGNDRAGRAKEIAYFAVCEGVTIDVNGELITALGTLAIAAFTLTLWLTSKEQGRLTQASIKLARDEFVASHRAWMATPEPRLDGVISADRKIIVELIIFNKGSHPAIGVNHHGMVMMVDRPENISYAPELWSSQFAGVIRLEKDLAQPVKGHVTIFPEQYHSVPVRFPPGNFLPDADVLGLIQGKKILVMYGCIGYLTLDEPHYTPYCLYLTRDDSLPNKYRFGTAPIGNEAV